VFVSFSQISDQDLFDQDLGPLASCCHLIDRHVNLMTCQQVLDLTLDQDLSYQSEFLVLFPCQRVSPD